VNAELFEDGPAQLPLDAPDALDFIALHFVPPDIQEEGLAAVEDFGVLVIEAQFNVPRADIDSLQPVILEDRLERAGVGDQVLPEEVERETARDVEVGGEVYAAGDNLFNHGAAAAQPFDVLAEDSDGGNHTAQPEGAGGDADEDVGVVLEFRCPGEVSRGA